MTEVQLFLLGSPQLFLDGADVSLEARKPAALLYYLAVSAETHTRDHLGTLLWPEQDQVQARAYLRRALWSLKQIGLEDWLVATRETVTLKPGYWLDVAAFRDALESGDSVQAAELYRDDFLAGFTLPDCPDFDEWQFFHTEQMRDGLAQGLAAMVERHAQMAEFNQAIDFARRWLALDPLREEVHRWLMRLYAYDGQQAAALRQYEECLRLLDQELGVEPDPETKDLYEAIRSRRLLWGVAPAPGAVLQGRYRLEAELGQGGMGIVYQATDTLLERAVAVKVLSKADPAGEFRSRLLAEARAVASLNHPNIVVVYDAGEYNGIPFIVMELVQGQTLRKVAQPSMDEILRLAQETCAALDHAHQNGIIHRDLKLDNVIITPGQTAKLTDFGLARVTGRSRLTQEDTLMGTIAYLAPELILGRPASPQSDLYALGVMLYELAAGRPPFEGDNPAVLLTNHLHAPVVPPGAYNPNITPALDALITQLLDKEAARRPASAAAVQEQLARIAKPALPGLVEAAEAPAVPLLGRIARGRLIGRVDELAEATQLWLHALSGQAGLLLVSGEPGIGKTRLAQAIIAQARIGGATVFSGGCYEFEATTPYLPVAEALREWVHGLDAEALRAQLGSTATELARLAPEIEAKLGPLPPSPTLSPDEQRLRLFDNIAQFMDNLSSEQGLLFFVDDLHWADRGTLALLSYLMRRLRQAKLLVIAAYREVELDRSHPLADALVQWNRQRLANRIQLARFTIPETNTMIATLFGQERVSDEFAGAIHRETEGNPFFIEEVAKALVEQGQIYWVDNHWERADLEELAIPQSIKEAIGRRLNRLSTTCVEVLHTAAVIGKDFAYSLLAAVSDKNEDQILDALDEAITAQLIRPLMNEVFVFTHDKIREVLYDEILTVRRNRLHRHIAQALEAGEGGDPASRVEDLAYHTIAAGILDKGMAYAQRAAENAQELFASDEALQYYRQANECALSLGDKATQAAIQEAMGDIFSGPGPFSEAINHYEQAMALVPAGAKRAAIRVKIGLVYNQTNDEQGIAILEQALEELDPSEHPLEVALALAALGRFYHYRCEYSAAIDLFEKARQMAEPLGDPLTLSYIYAYLSGAYQHLAYMEQSMAWSRTNIAMGEETGYLPAVAAGYEFIAENYTFMGHWDQALEAARNDRQIGKKIGSASRVAWGQWVYGLALWGKGNLQPAVAEVEGAIDIATTIGEYRLVGLGYISLAMAHSDLGHESDAFEYLNRALEETRRRVELFQQGYALQASGYVYVQHEQWRQALDAYRQIDELLGHTENRDIALYSRPYHAEALLALGEQAEAAALLSASLQLAQETGSPFYEAVTHRVQGQLFTRRADFDSAAAVFERAIALSHETGGRLEQGRAHTQRALMYRQQGERGLARQDASQAQTIFTSCQASRDLGRVVALLEGLGSSGS